MPGSKQPKKYKGVPKELNLSDLKIWIKGRVSPKRFEHIEGVTRVGAQLTDELNIDPYLVLLGCWLHDACKEMKNRELLSEAKRLGLKPTRQEIDYPHILHGPVAALTVREIHDITNHDVLSAIAEHTLGSTEMSLVSKVVYLADTLEQSRPSTLTDPIWQALGTQAFYDKTKKEKQVLPLDLNLDLAIYQASNLVLGHLIEKGKPVHIKAVKVRNHFLELTKQKSATEPD